MFKKWKTRKVFVGKIPVGGNEPIRIQSMTNTFTAEAEATVEQILRLEEVGCEIVRVTVQGKREAEACEKIKDLLLKKGSSIPLVADIHFSPQAALWVAEFVEKIRINPGNYSSRKFQPSWDEKTCKEEEKRIEEHFFPLIEKCKKFRRALRIGVNYGSLSDRILYFYGNTSKGMVVSALEFATLCRKWEFHDIIFSMKSSNPFLAIEAYELLVEEMMKLGWDYPLHLGVTEAGSREEGKIRSAIGIGTLLAKGIGDTIRVSLTGDPVEEIEPAKLLATLYGRKNNEEFSSLFSQKPFSLPRQTFPFSFENPVALRIHPQEVLTSALVFDIGLGEDFKKKVSSVDALLFEGVVEDPKLLSYLQKIQESGVFLLSRKKQKGMTPCLSLKEAEKDSRSPFVLWIDLSQEQEKQRFWATLKPLCLFLSFSSVEQVVKFFSRQKHTFFAFPIFLAPDFSASKEELFFREAVEVGALLQKGFGKGIALKAYKEISERRKFSFSLLQMEQKRITATEYISCPCCGRTLYDLPSLVDKVKKSFPSLPGVKVAIMGCKVNGLKEMGDADFGCVGSQKDCVDLYVGKECVERNVPVEDASRRLLAYITSTAYTFAST